MKFKAQIKNNKLTFESPSNLQRFLELKDGKKVLVDIKVSYARRSYKQNNALHLYCQQLADELNNSGLDMKQVLKSSVDIPWTTETVKDYLWRPVQKQKTGKKSTTDLTKNEVSEIYEIINRYLGEKTGVYVEFPHEAPIEGLDF